MGTIVSSEMVPGQNGDDPKRQQDKGNITETATKDNKMLKLNSRFCQLDDMIPVNWATAATHM